MARIAVAETGDVELTTGARPAHLGPPQQDGAGDTEASTAHAHFLRNSHFSALDGVRAISILLVVAHHMPAVWWQGLHGNLGVTMFFVLSGFLITTLSLREESRRGSVSLSAFYVRRAFRIFPLYFVVLAVYTVLFATNGGVDLQERALFLKGLPHYLTFTNEFVRHAAFNHTWSLGYEEKFYLAWPILAFVLLRSKASRRWGVTLGLTGGLVILEQMGLSEYALVPYVSILFGCLAAIFLHSPAQFERVRAWCNSYVTSVALVTVVILQFTQHRLPFGNLMYGACVSILLVTAVASGGRLGRLLSWQGFRLIAARSYGMYLVHLLVIAVVTPAVGGVGSSNIASLVAYLLVLGLAVGTAEILYRCVEKPCIEAGRRLSARLMKRKDEATGLALGRFPVPTLRPRGDLT